MSILDIVDNAKGSIINPRFSDEYNHLIWIMGRDNGVYTMQHHVRFNSTKDLPFLKKPPRYIHNTIPSSTLDIWLSGYNAVIKYVADEATKLINNYS